MKKIDSNIIVKISCFAIVIMVFINLSKLVDYLENGVKVIVQNKEIVQLDNGKKVYYLKGDEEMIEVNQKIYKLAKVNSTMRIQHRDIVTIVKIKE